MPALERLYEKVEPAFRVVFGEGKREFQLATDAISLYLEQQQVLIFTYTGKTPLVVRSSYPDIFLRQLASHTLVKHPFLSKESLDRASAGLACPFGKVRVIGRDALADRSSQRRILLPDHNQPVRVAVGKLSKQDTIHHAEHGRIGADAQRQHDDHNRGKDRRSPQQAEGMTEVLDQVGRVHGNKDDLETCMLALEGKVTVWGSEVQSWVVVKAAKEREGNHSAN